MEYLKGTHADVFAVNNRITKALGFTHDTEIKNYASITECTDGEYAIIIIPEIKKYLTTSEISGLVEFIDVVQELQEMENEID